MQPRHGRAQPTSSLLVAAGVVLLTGLLLAALRGPSVAAAPVAQVQPPESPTPRSAATPQPSPTPTRTPAEELAELEQRKLTYEIRLLDSQIDRMRQQEGIDSQAWRAPAAAIALLGPTLVGLGLLFLLARALSHWLPARPADAESLDDEDEENP